MRSLLFDIEANGLLDEVTKIHCIVAKHMETGKTWRFYEPRDDIEPVSGRDWPLAYVRPAFTNADRLIGHNITGYDNTLLERFFGIDLTDKFIFDTMVWSQTLNPDRKMPKGCPAKVYNPVTLKMDTIGPHSVAAWGYRVARHKPAIHDWSTFTPAILHRCDEDVGIQEKIMEAVLKEADLELENVFI